MAIGSPLVEALPEPEPWRVLIDDTSVTNVVFVGYARTQTAATSASLWLIARLLVSGTNVISREYATQQFDQVWDDRTTIFPTAPFINARSILCDGIDDYISIGNVTELDKTNVQPFSISVWFRSTTTATGERILFSKQGGGNNAGYRLSSQSNQIRFHISGGAAGNRIEVRTGTVSPNDQAWHNVVATYDGSSAASGCNIWYDGVDQTLTLNADTLSSSSSNSIAAQYSGRNGASNEWDGFLDEITFWNKQLTPAEVAEIYNAGDPDNIATHSAVANNQGWWRHDGDLFPTILDQGPNTSNSATMTNMSPTALVGEVP